MIHKAGGVQPSWRQVFELWQSHDVPEVEVVSWDLSSDFQGPWDTRENRSTRRGYYPCSNPEFQTAHHICHLFPKLTTELRAAYKLTAYCVQNDLGGFESALVNPTLSKHREEIGYLWHPNARRVIPLNVEYTIQGGRLEPKQVEHWREIVRLAAQTWTTLARDWVVVRVPSLMDRGSPEHAAWEEHATRKHEEQERREYERLKAKFEPD